ncbi:hypothetical protein BDR04DRAFT_1102692, partial [Suillus decipiens]
ISSDLKLRIPVLRHVQGLSIKQIFEVLGIRKSLVYQTLQLYDKLADDINYIKSHCYLHNSVFLDELQSQLLLRRRVKISLSTLIRTLRHLGLTLKKVSRHALERNEENALHS